MSVSNSSNVPTWRVIAAFAAVYLIWGSTYLAIRFALQTLPPFLMAGIRFLLVGVILYGLTAWRGTPRPTRPQWKSTIIIGGLLLMCGNGGVTWAEQTLPSGITALVVAIVPLWMVLLDWLRPGGTRPGGTVLVGVLIGLAGIALLVGPTEGIGASSVNPFGVTLLMGTTFCWAVGSLYSRSAPLPASPLRTTSMEMLAGGVMLTLLGTLQANGDRSIWRRCLSNR